MKIASLALLVALGTSSATAQTVPQPGTADYDRWVGEQLARLQQFADRDAVRQLIYHYGRGTDELGRNYADRESGARRAAAEYEKAFTNDVQITVYPLRSTTPLRQVRGLAEWIPFVNGFYDQAKYSNTLHLMSNFDIAFPNANTAHGTAFGYLPHYIRSTAKDAAGANVTVENMIARYEFSASRRQDGSWRITDMTVHLDEIQRQSGFFPNGQQPGR